MKKSKAEKQEKKQYERYVSQFMPKSKFVSNGIKAFVVGGLICVAGAFMQQGFQLHSGMNRQDAATLVTLILIVAAQLLTGLGLFAPIAKFAGAGVIVPITGFANSMVATAIEFKSEGPVLGVGSNLFKLAGPVIVCGISISAIIGIIYYLLGIFGTEVANIAMTGGEILG